MNRLQQYSPKLELANNKVPQLRRCRTLITFGIMLMLLLLWAYFCRGCINLSDSNSLGFGGGNAGLGSGSGNSGDGPGAGKNGSGKGKFDSAQGKLGIGKDSSAPGTDNPATGDLTVESTANTPAAAVLKQLPLHVESIVETAIQPTPVQINTTPQTGGAPQGRKGFYGVAVHDSARVLFIIDCSGSMGARSTELPDKTRLEVMKMELEKAIFNKNRSQYSTGAFAIVNFSDDAAQFPPRKKGLCRYTETKKLKQAQEFIDQLQAGGSTNMKTAWEAGIEIIKKYRIDTVYFLTDGEPTDNFDVIWLKAAMKKNHVARISVNCVAIGNHGKDRMQAVAKEFRGSFVFIP